jgi:hypothetical protein
VRHARDCPHDDRLVHAAGKHFACARLAPRTSRRLTLRRCW